MIKDNQDLTMNSVFTSRTDFNKLHTEAYQYASSKKKNKNPFSKSKFYISDFDFLKERKVNILNKKFKEKEKQNFFFHRLYRILFGKYMEDSPYYDERAIIEYYDKWDRQYCSECNSPLNDFEKSLKLENFYKGEFTTSLAICNKCINSYKRYKNKNPLAKK